jgi:dTDP-glucose 4,6-dehydratase
MRMLVTGGAGFIGSNFVRHALADPENRVVNLDKLTYAGNPNNLKGLEKSRNYEFVKGDVCDRKVVERLVKDADAIVHFAAETHVDRSIIDAGAFV